MSAVAYSDPVLVEADVETALAELRLVIAHIYRAFVALGGKH